MDRDWFLLMDGKRNNSATEVKDTLKSSARRTWNAARCGLTAKMKQMHPIISRNSCVIPSHQVWDDHRSGQFLFAVNGMNQTKSHQSLSFQKTVQIFGPFGVILVTPGYNSGQVKRLSLFLGLVISDINGNILGRLPVSQYFPVIVTSNVDRKGGDPAVDSTRQSFWNPTAIFIHKVFRSLFKGLQRNVPGEFLTGIRQRVLLQVCICFHRTALRSYSSSFWS